ncbi:uncharacterized protein LOC27208685 [Drosophila simulans]|uniref:Uncharacterized protein n=1 Tax=Drosophila simulans TaxID=7240 RepID=A0A0J9RD71_DROSI|nr:uncharacterized protein LOC27208685 [Drosophila simulans]KMY93911.1 uncharacterized protein Dsimw501_GD28841 [Drosophila simulans]
MPGQYSKYKCTRLIMTALRSYLSILYLWGILQLAAITPIPCEIWDTSFWFAKRSYKVAYKSFFTNDLTMSLCVCIMILGVLINLYQCCRCRLLGARIWKAGVAPLPMYKPILILTIPYISVFVLTWLITTNATYRGIIFVAKSEVADKSGRAICLLVIGLLMKLLVLANFYSVCIRIWAYLNILNIGSNEYLENNYNFGDHLNLFFCV